MSVTTATEAKIRGAFVEADSHVAHKVDVQIRSIETLSIETLYERINGLIGTLSTMDIASDGVLLAMPSLVREDSEGAGPTGLTLRWVEVFASSPAEASKDVLGVVSQLERLLGVTLSRIVCLAERE